MKEKNQFFIEKSFVKNWPQKVHAFTDGASRGNPGMSSLGLIVFSEEKKPVYQYAEYLGNKTNNYAEYMGVLSCLKICFKNKVSHLSIHTDSQLLVRQMQKVYQVKNLSLKNLFRECEDFIEKFEKVDFLHIPREQNKEADSLANEILDLYLSQ